VESGNLDIKRKNKKTKKQTKEKQHEHGSGSLSLIWLLMLHIVQLSFVHVVGTAPTDPHAIEAVHRMSLTPESNHSH
jgi:hypothetical protein